MDSLPPELIQAIAVLLRQRDLYHFRLTCRGFAAATSAIVMKNVSVLDTSHSLSSLLSFVQSRRTKLPTRTLTIYSGDWSSYSKEEWLVHPLLRWECNSKLSMRGNGSADAIEAGAAFMRYTNFINKETSRDPAEDLRTLESIAQHMPSLTSFALVPLHQMGLQWSQSSKVGTLARQIWMLPSPRCAPKTLDRVLELSLVLGSIDELSIYGKLHLNRLPRRESQTIRTLRIFSATISCTSSLVDFLSSFPGVRSLQLSMRIRTALNLDCVTLPEIRSLKLQNVNVSEDSLLGFMLCNARLETIYMDEDALSTGSWRTFYGRMPTPRRLVQVVLNESWWKARVGG